MGTKKLGTGRVKISDQVQSLEEKASIVDSFISWPLDDAQVEADTQASGSNEKTRTGMT